MSEINKKLFGLDISDRALRLVKLAKNGKKITLISFNEIAVPPGVIINGDLMKADILTDLVKELIKSTNGKKIKYDNMIAVLPETRTFIKVINLPAAKSEPELIDSIFNEIKNHIPLTPEEIYMDWQIISDNQTQLKVLIGAAPKIVADSYYDALSRTGYAPYVMEIEASAISRCLIAEKDRRPKIIIDFGANRTGLIIFDNNVPQFTVSLPISGNKITETIAKTLQLDATKAEEAKILCGLDTDKCEGAIKKILMAPIDSLAREIKKAMAFYQDNFANASPIAEIILCGGGANFAKIDKVLSEKLKIPVTIGNPLTNILLPKKFNLSASKLLSYTTAIGLALRTFQKNN